MAKLPPFLNYHSLNVKYAVAIDFGNLTDPLMLRWIHFHPIDSKNPWNDGTDDLEKAYKLYEDNGYGSMITSSYEEYQYLLHELHLPVIWIDPRYLPKMLNKTVCSGSSTTSTSTDDDDNWDVSITPHHKWMIHTVHDLNSQWNNRSAPNAYFRAYRLARQVEHLKTKICQDENLTSTFDMNNQEHFEKNELSNLLENLHFKLSVYDKK